jgi:hypothetical protein
MLVIVVNNESDGTSCGFPFENAAQQFHFVGLMTTCRDAALPRASPVKFILDEIHVDFYTCGETVYHSPHGLTMAFTKRRQCEYVAECIAHLLYY